MDKSDKYQVSEWLLANLKTLKLAYENNKFLTVMFFIAAHLISSTFSIPGSCTLLNTLSGAVFGFWKGCLIVYCVTILGSCLGYFLGKKLPLNKFKTKYEKNIRYLSGNLTDSSFFLLIILRLSPLLPFGIINIILGFLGLNFGVYLATTVIGVFFDVVLLNSIGAMISGASSFNALDKWRISLVFFALILLYCVKIMRSKLKISYKEEHKI